MKHKYRLPELDYPQVTIWWDLIIATIIWLIFAVNAFCQVVPTDVRTRPSGVLLDLAWSSCPEDGGEWTERSFRYIDSTTHKARWTLHLGPQQEFALFKGDGDRGEHLAHSGA